MCNVILTFLVILSNGRELHQMKWMSDDVAKDFISRYYNNKEFRKGLKEDGVVEVKNWKITKVKPYDCLKGPSK